MKGIPVMSETFSTTQESAQHVTIKKALAVFAVGVSAFGIAGCQSEHAAASDESAVSSSECTAKFNAGEAEDIYPVIKISPETGEFAQYTQKAGGDTVKAYKQYLVDQVTEGFTHAQTEDGEKQNLSDSQLDHVLAGVRKTVDNLHNEGKTLPLADEPVMFGERYNVNGSKVSESDTPETSEYCVLIATKSDN
jgi:hypothetical protein